MSGLIYKGYSVIRICKNRTVILQKGNVKLKLYPKKVEHE